MRVPEKEVPGLVVGQASRASVSATRFHGAGEPAARPELCSNETAPVGRPAEGVASGVVASGAPVEGASSGQPKGWPLWKRALDIACIVVAIPLLIPLMLLIAAVIFVVSPGPVLYLHPRVGYRGRLFICFKFRTMKVKA